MKTFNFVLLAALQAYFGLAAPLAAPEAAPAPVAEAAPAALPVADTVALPKPGESTGDGKEITPEGPYGDFFRYYGVI